MQTSAPISQVDASFQVPRPTHAELSSLGSSAQPDCQTLLGFPSATYSPGDKPEWPQGSLAAPSLGSPGSPGSGVRQLYSKLSPGPQVSRAGAFWWPLSPSGLKQKS